MNNGKPENGQELQQDIENHPERGKINGEDVVKFDGESFQLTIPKELYRTLLEIGGAMGVSKREVLLIALTRFVADVGNISLVERSQSIKAEKYNVPVTQIRSKVLGAYKRIGRDRVSRINKAQGTSQE